MTQQFMPDADLAYTVLSDLKRVTREYATAATESVCPTVRQTFTQLLNATLQMQGELYNTMQSNNMYNASSPALKQDIDKQIKTYQTIQQQTQQFVQSTKSLPAWQQQPAQQAQMQQH